MTETLKIVIPMAGLGTRLRPLTWSRPKPLISLAGRTVLDHLLDMFLSVPGAEHAEYVFILSPNQRDLIQEHMAKNHAGKQVHYVLQPEMKGQSDAIWQAREYLKGRMLMVFSDTLIENHYEFLANERHDAVAWVKAVPDPRRFGVAEVNSSGMVTRLIEKPRDMNNNLAVVGFYYFREAEKLLEAIEEQIKREIALRGEFYLVDAINILLDKGIQMRTESVETWLDAGTPEALLDTNRYLLEHGRDNTNKIKESEDNVIIPPVYIHPEARINGSIIGPFTSIGAGSVIQSSIIRDTVISPGAHVTNTHLDGSILGHHVVLNGIMGKFNLGDNCWGSW